LLVSPHLHIGKPAGGLEIVMIRIRHDGDRHAVHFGRRAYERRGNVDIDVRKDAVRETHAGSEGGKKPPWRPAAEIGVHESLLAIRYARAKAEAIGV
jgi:hypothetical protein